MPVSSGEHVKALLDHRMFVTLATLNADGSPQLSILWATYDGDDVLMSTVAGRRKERYLRRDPRAGVMATNPDNAYDYAEIRGRVTITEVGGGELIDALSERYRGSPYDAEPEGTVRVILRLTPERIFTVGA